MSDVEPAAGISSESSSPRHKTGKHFYMKQEKIFPQRTLLFKISLFPLLEITGPDQEEQNHTSRDVYRLLLSTGNPNKSYKGNVELSLNV